MAGVYDVLYKESPYRLGVYKPSERPSWYDMSDIEQMRTLRGKQQQLAELPQPERRKNKRLRAAYEPFKNVLVAIGSILNVPSAMISGTVKQLVDGVPGFDTQEYFKEVFTLRDQVSWRDVIGFLAEGDEDQNIWDRKFVQIVGGLVLDIALDPTTYFFGTGAAKKLIGMGKYTKDIAKVTAKIPDLIGETTKIMKMTPEANKIFNNTIRAAYRVRGIKWPFQATVKIPLQGKRARAVRGVLEEAIPRLEKLAPYSKVAGKYVEIMPRTGRYAEELLKVGKKIEPLAKIPSAIQRVGNALRRFLPGYRFMEEAFAPMTRARIPVIEAKLTMGHKIGRGVSEVEKEILGAIKKQDYSGLRRLTEIAEDVPFVDDALVKITREVSTLNAKIIRTFLRGGDWQKQMARLAERNADYGNWLHRGLIKIMSNYDNQKALAKINPLFTPIRKPTGKELFKQIDFMMDDILARQYMRMMQKTKMDVGDLKSIAKWKPEKDIKAFIKMMGKDMDIDQKKSLFTLMETVRDSLNKAWDVEFAKGIPSNYIDDYMQRTTAIKKIGMPKEFGAKPRFTLHRFDEIPQTERFDDAVEALIERGQARTKAHARRLLREGRAKGYPKMVDTISESWYNRMVAHYKAIYKKEFLDQMPEYGLQVGKDVAAPEGMAKVMGMSGKTLDELSDFVFDIDTAEYINRALNVITDDRAVNSFMRQIDKTQGWWKALVTVVNPGFHFRNMYSNHFLGWIRHGVKYFKPKAHADGLAMTLQVLYPDNPAIWKAFRISRARLDESVYAGKTLREMASEITDYGVIRTGVRRAEAPLMKGVRGGEKGAKRFLRRMNIAGTESAIAKIGEGVGGIVESQARATNFLMEMGTFGDVGLAARKTQEIFVDYANLTEFERVIGRRVFPFWSWLKQNTANQIKFVFSQPGRYGKIARVAQAVEAGAKKIPENERPEWFASQWMWQLPITMPDGTALFFNPNYPFQDLNKLDPKEFRRTVMSSMTPFLKTPIELATGYEFFKKAPIERYPGYKAPVPGILQDVVKILPESIRKTLKIEKDKDGRYRMNPKTAHAITNLLPFVRNTSKLMMREPTRIPADKYFQWASYTLGIKIKPVDPLTQQYYATLDAIRKRKKELTEQGISY